ncbi:MAG: tetratricopeptide repeat protein [Rhodobiaceae bacterium]|nr:tetratricopeptide repeat protein [Rhodobiaceae bacterium]
MRGIQGLAIVGALLGSVTVAQANGVEDNNNCYEQFRGGDMKLAIYYCSRAIQSGDLEQGDMVVALLNRGVAYKNTGNLEMAVVDYSSALELSPNDALLFSNRANAYRELNKLVEAMSDINRSIELNPENPAAFYVRGLLFEAMGDAENARRDFLRAHEISPDDKEFRERAKALGVGGQ